MSGKIILSAVLIAFVVLELDFALAQGKYLKVLKCYTYENTMPCHNPKIQTCDQKSAENTHDQLTKYFPNISSIANTEFQCLSMSYVYENSTVMAVGGCINSGMNTCSLSPFNRTWILKECRSCSTSLCTLTTGFNETSCNNTIGNMIDNTTNTSDQTVHHFSSSTSNLVYSKFIIGLFLVMLVN